MAKKFDYNSAYLDMKKSEPDIDRPGKADKTREELAKEKLEAERAQAQAVVDDVLYSDPEDHRKRHGQSAQHTESTQPVEPVNQEVEPEVEQIKEEPKEEIAPKKPTVVSTTASPSAADPLVSGFDAVLSGKEDDSDVIEEDISQYTQKDEPSPREPAYPVEEPVPVPQVKKQPTTRNSSRTSSRSDSPLKTSVLKEFPTDMANYVKSLFPSANTIGEAVAAYIYLMLGQSGEFQTPDRIKEISKHYNGEIVSNQNVQDNVIDAINQVKIAQRAISQKLTAIELGTSYILAERSGFTKGTARSVEDLNFLESSVTSVSNKLDKDAEMKTVKDAQKKGRPIR